MNSISHCIGPTGKLLRSVTIGLSIVASMHASRALADGSLTALYQHQTLHFTHIDRVDGNVAIGVGDPALQTLLRESGAILTWKAGERYVLITTAIPVVVSFAIGDRRYDVGPIGLEAPFAPYERSSEVYLPFNELLRGLDLALRQDGAVAVLQPQLTTLDVRNDGDRVSIVAHAGAPLHFRVVKQSANSVTYEFDGVGTTLAGTRQINSGGVRSVELQQLGTARDPKTFLTLALAGGAKVIGAANSDDRDVALTVAGGAGAAPVALLSPTPVPPEAAPTAAATAQPGPALVTGVAVQPSNGGVSITIAVSGNATYEWHRLRDPDNRFWIDIKNAQLQGPAVDQDEPSPLVSMRVRQGDPTTVRVALSLVGPQSIAFAPSTSGLEIDVGNGIVADAPRFGSGSVGSVVSAATDNAGQVTPAPLDQTGTQSYDATAWKFGPRGGYVPTNPRLIVIDPGHGGSDPGTMHGGVRESDLTLDMAKRLRDILVSRGWEVKLTHDTNVDVYAPYDSAHEELQARDDIANQAGARLFVSIHVNGYVNSGPYGTTYYVSKPDDVALAHALETQLAADGTKDDGIIKSHLYVTLHALMPAVLVETAFLTNPSDYTLLTSSAWRQKVAEKLADGIAQYMQEYPVPNQPTQ